VFKSLRLARLSRTGRFIYIAIKQGEKKW